MGIGGTVVGRLDAEHAVDAMQRSRDIKCIGAADIEGLNSDEGLAGLVGSVGRLGYAVERQGRIAAVCHYLHRVCAHRKDKREIAKSAIAATVGTQLGATVAQSIATVYCQSDGLYTRVVGQDGVLCGVQLFLIHNKIAHLDPHRRQIFDTIFATSCQKQGKHCAEQVPSHRPKNLEVDEVGVGNPSGVDGEVASNVGTVEGTGQSG